MKRYIVVYSDNTFSNRQERFETKAYPIDKAKEIADALACMGCHDFEYKPEERIAA